MHVLEQGDGVDSAVALQFDAHRPEWLLVPLGIRDPELAKDGEGRWLRSPFGV
jgi:hypothetical protein